MKRKVKVPIEDYESIDELIDPKQPKFDLNNVQSLKTHGYWSHSSSTNNNDSGSKENQVVIDLSKEDDENGKINSTNIPATNNRIPTTTTSNSHQAISNNNDNVEWWRETFKQPASKPPLPIPSSSTSSNNIISDDYLFYKPGVVTVPSLPVTASSNRSALSRDQLPSLTSIHSYDHKSSSNNYHGDQTRSSDFYQQNGFYSKKKTYSSSTSSSLDDILDDEDVLRKESWDPTKQLDTSTSVYTDGALMYDVTALDVGYEKLTEKLRDGPSSEAAFKSKTPAFDIRQAMMVDTESVKPSGSSSSSSFLVSSHLALAALESSAQHNESMRLADSMQEVNIDSLYRRLLSRPLDAILSYSETDTEKPHTHSSTATSNHSNYNSHNKIMNTDSAIERPENNKYTLPVLSSPRIRFLNESQYVQYFEDRQLREVLAATASHLRTLRITAIGSSTQRGNGTAGKAHRHGGAAYIEAQVYETAHLITQCIQVTEHKACSRPQVTNTSSSISSSSSSSQLMEVEFGSRFESGHGSSVHSVGRRDVRAEGSVLKDDLVLIIRHHKVDANGIG